VFKVVNKCLIFFAATINMDISEENSEKLRKERPGIVYLSRIPRRMNVKQIRHVFGSFGEVGRIFLKPVGE